MKFSFCGDQSVPEWFLSQLNLLSNLSFIKLRKIAGLYVSSLVDPGQAQTYTAQILETLLSSDFSENESKTIIAMLDFITTNTAKNNVDQEQLMKELIDLGIPKENCQSLCKVMEQSQEKLRAHFRQKVLRMNRFEDLQVKKWTVPKNSSNGKKNGEYYELKVSISDNKIMPTENIINFCADKNTLQRFSEEMAAVMKLLSGQTE